MSRVLIVDDSLIVRKRLQEELEQLEKVESVRGIGDPLEALRVIARDKPDIVVLDVNMPRMSGVELLDRLSGRTGRPVVIMFTHQPQAQNREECLRRGADYFFDKSADLGELIETVRRESDGNDHT